MRTGPPPTASTTSSSQDDFQVQLSLQGVYYLLHRLGLSLLMPRPQYKDADERVLEAFKEIINDHLQPIQDLHPYEGSALTFGRGSVRPARDVVPGVGQEGLTPSGCVADVIG